MDQSQDVQMCGSDNKMNDDYGKGKRKEIKEALFTPGNQRDGRGSAGKAWPRAVPQGRVFGSRGWQSYREWARRQGYSWSHTY